MRVFFFLPASQGVQQDLQNALHVAEHIVVPEANDAKALCRKEPAAGAVSLGCMLPPVNFDDQPRFQTTEVDDVAINRPLAAELVTAKAASANFPPQCLLGVRGIAT